MSTERIAKKYLMQQKLKQWLDDAQDQNISHRTKSWMADEALELVDVCSAIQARNWQLLETEQHWVIVPSRVPVKIHVHP